MYGVPLILDATRISENALFVKDREPEHARRPLPELIREITSLSDGAIFSSKKDHFVPIGGMLCLNDDALAQRARELVVVYEGFPHYGGLAGHDMEALAQGIRESTDEALIRHYVGQSAFLGDAAPARAACRSSCRSARMRSSSTRSGSCRTCRRSSSRRRRSPRRCTSRAACGRWSEGSSPASTATSPTTGSSSCG